MKITRYEYLKNEADHAEQVALSLPEGEERDMFAAHAANLNVRLGKMSREEGEIVMLDTED